MTVTVYKSTDASAPVLTGQAGKLIDLLDAVLVNGYGSKAAQGWSKVYSGTNKAAYRSNDSTSNRFYLRVDDGATITAGLGKEGAIRGFESMTDVDTGTGPFPTVAQWTNGMVWTKSTTADATARAWCLVGDGRTLYVRLVNGSQSLLGGFGHCNSFRPGDNFNSFIAGHAVNGAAAAQNTMGTAPTVNGITQASQVYLPRPYHQLGGAINIYPNMYPLYNNAANNVLILGAVTVAVTYGWLVTYPTTIDQTMHFLPHGIFENTSGTTWNFRALFPGMYVPLHSNPLTDLDTVPGGTLLPGRTLMGLTFNSNNAGGAPASQFLVDTTGPWT